jgi:uncharacterized protein (DUF2126 family)
MTVRVALQHRTTYQYDRVVTLSPQVIRLRPAPHARTPIQSYSLAVEPAGHFLNWQQDPFGNFLARAVFRDAATHLNVQVDLIADLEALNPFNFFIDPSAEQWPFVYEPQLAKDLTPYREGAAVGPRLHAFLAGISRERVRTIDFLVEVNRFAHASVGYVIRMDPGVQTPEETLEKGTGSCRDSAWLLVQALRHLGFAARFASGYLIQLAPDEKPLDGPPGPAHDFADLHAWAEAYVPGAGWIGLDPTSGLLAGEGHIPLACTPDPSSAAAITGAVDECKVVFSFALSVERIREDPRVTRPYTDSQWAAIDALGGVVDERLALGDVRLTQGGEPTFVSIDEPDAPEWNTTALGGRKAEHAEDLLRRLHARFAPGGLLYFGQGKWYPGESLPRWAYGCYWRRDGEPVWDDPALLADSRAAYGFGAAQAQDFVTALAKRLDVDPGFAQPAYEDAWYYLWRERRLPTNVDPHDSKLEDADERARLARVLDQGLGSLVGYALPLAPKPAWNGGDAPRWHSGPWFLRRERLYLLPGDSPMGYRLPLDSLPWVEQGQAPFLAELDPFEARAPLARRHLLQRHVAVSSPDDPARPAAPDTRARPGLGESAPWIVRTALCVEPRGGALHVFFPPVGRLEEYLALVQAVEETAAALRLPVRPEGYTPPPDPRLAKLEVTPDPGVIEVNVAPVATWRELVANTTGLYEEARLARLRSEKFMLDGGHTGTGGGNHVTLGGPTAADSPLLRRPDLLRSLIGYWQDHPSLSYLFSGLFIGPTSQSPRVDEARSDSLHELELAFRKLPVDARGSSGTPPWLVDRALRNLLIDATGNTHRTEHCIDKLYSPDGARGRQGIVELRGFEMPPHARMSCVQQLLVRALVARFWDEPYEPRLVRYETQLHDRFMLPHFVEHDFRDVLEELRRSGLQFDPTWFAPFLEFRFPNIGEIAKSGIWLELRRALEPWHVLGEEPGGAGTVRYVDSSLERVQVKVRGGLGERYRVACNGRTVPLHPTGTRGESVAGVRFRAWQPPTCLHPTIPVHAPLVFEVVDTWLERSLGGCTYHVSHPGGRSHDRLPVNASEAESRRIARFSVLGHTPGRVKLAPAAPSPDFPLTLDLRWS